MWEDMRHFVVFRLPQEQWETGELNYSTLSEWIRQNTTEGKPCVAIGETDFRHSYHIVGFSTQVDAMLLADHLRTFPFVEVAFGVGTPHAG